MKTKMTSRQRLLTTISGKLPDRVPVTPDTSNMIPARLTGLPFWDIYLYQKIPQWKTYIDCARHFGFDAFMDGYGWVNFSGLDFDPDEKEKIERGTAIILKNDERIVTQEYEIIKGKQKWSELVHIYYADNPPDMWVHYSKARVPAVPEKWEELEGVVKHPQGEPLIKWMKDEMGEQGLVGVFCGFCSHFCSEQDIYNFYDNPGYFYKKAENQLDYAKKRFEVMMGLEHKPDFICLGSSGTLVFQTVETFRELSLPFVKELTALCKKHGIPSHIHSCGPEKELVKICAEETDLTIIDPLEVPPMGDCNLKEIKRLYGDKLVLKGNLHTTSVMLEGTAEKVREASRKAIEDAAEGGRFILSTGDQCGRDTPDENIYAMIEAVEEYGRF